MTSAIGDDQSSGVAELVAVMDRLRRECPWTGAQTHASLARYLLEEAHETLDAIDRGDSADLRDELGDLLLQIVFHARIAAEGEGWDLGDVVRGLTAKLVRRNPHVFAGGAARTVEEIDAAWEAVKATERPARSSVHEGIPATLPALAYAEKVLGRLDEQPAAEDSIGARLLALVAEARAQGLDAETELRAVVRGLGE